MEFIFNPLSGELEISGASVDVLGRADKMALVKCIKDVPPELEIEPDTHYVILLEKDLQMTLAIEGTDDGYSHAFIIDLITRDDVPSVSFEPAPYFKWVKPLELSANKIYKIIIENNVAMWLAVDNY